jgi:acyl dehydratase
MGNPELEAKVAPYIGIETGPPERGGDAVNTAMIHHWCDAMGDRNSIYSDATAAQRSRHRGIVAPPTMLQAWVMAGYAMASPETVPIDKQRELHQIFDAYGYTGVVATNCDQVYRRYVRPGDEITGFTTIDTVSGEKTTGLGTGHFIETKTLFRDQRGEEVGSMVFRVLKFAPRETPKAAANASGAAPAAATRPAPAVLARTQAARVSPRSDAVKVGDRLPPLDLPITTSLIVAGALASRDYTPVHHDKAFAQSTGMPDVFMNILTTNGLVGRYVTDWAGPDAVFTKAGIRLGAPNTPGDLMKLRGVVNSVDAAARSLSVEVKGDNNWGNHVTGLVTLTLP